MTEDVFLASPSSIKNKEIFILKKFKELLTEFSVLQKNLPPVVVAMFFLSIVAMNLLANKSIGGLPEWLALDCGIIFSWVTFLLMDMVVKRYGMRAGNFLSVAALFANLFVALMFFFAGLIPGTWGESYVEGSEAVINVALDNTFRGTWFVLLGSSAAFLLAAFVNNGLNFIIGKAIKKKNFGEFALRAYVSTFIGQFVDNFTFALIVSHNFFGWTMLQCVTCALTGAVAELLFEVLFSPIGYRVAKKWEANKVGQNYLDYLQQKKEKTA